MLLDIKHSTSIFVIILITSLVNAQNVSFERVTPLPPAPQLIADIDVYAYGSSQIVDVDNDGDQDLIISGYSLDELAQTDIYLNDGQGNLKKQVDSEITGMAMGQLAVGDVDSDGDIDLIVCGYDLDLLEVHTLYLNDGQGHYSPSPQTFMDLEASSNIMRDFDNDGDLDYIVSGERIDDYELEALLYVNDGEGNFTLMNTPGIIPLLYADIQSVDIDGDNDLDIWISGDDENWGSEQSLMINDGTGVFSVYNGGLPDNVNNISFADIDNDGDQDISLIDSDWNLQIWTNNGFGSFDLKSSIIETFNNHVFLDIDLDGDMDIVATSGEIKYFINDGAGLFAESASNPLTEGTYMNILVADFNNDNYPDVFFHSDGEVWGEIAKSPICINDGNNQLQEIIDSPIDEMKWPEFTSLDMDGDNDLDLLVCGEYSVFSPDMVLYSNDGYGNLTKVDFPEGEILKYAYSVAGDIDGDGDIDIVQSGSVMPITDGSGRIYFYINDGNGNFEKKSNHGLLMLSARPILMDVDGDEDLDLYIDGFNPGSSHSNHLYLNDGLGNFAEMTGHGITKLWRSSISTSIADIDNDNDLDLIISGSVNPINGIYKSAIMRNDGAGHFSEINIPTINHGTGDVDVFDVDNNGTLDVIFVSSSGSEIWLNDGTGLFTASLTDDFPDSMIFDLESGDFDLDGDIDMIISGLDGTTLFTTYKENTGNGVFVDDDSVDLAPMYQGSLIARDFDADGKKDLIIGGSIYQELSFSRVYRNNTCFSTETQINVSQCGSYISPSGDEFTQSGIYEDIILNTEGCDSLIIINLEVLSGTTADLNITACDEIVSPSGEFIWTESGVYEDIVVNNVGCDSTITVDFTIENLNPIISQNGSALTVDIQGTSFQWYDCDLSTPIDGANSSELEVLANGNFYCEVTSANGCSFVSDCYEIVVSGIIDGENSFPATISPNPFFNNLVINLESKENFDLKIYDLNGKCVFDQFWNNAQNISFDPNINPGIYFVRMQIGNKVINEKLIRSK